jgi:hypothetical protein
MPEDLLTMSSKICRVHEGRLPQVKADEMMGMRARQVRRICAARTRRSGHAV